MSYHEILMPAMSPTMKTGKLVKWLINEGDVVSGGQVIAEVETDKAVMDVEAFEEGKIIKLLYESGAPAIEVNKPIAQMETRGALCEEEDTFESISDSCDNVDQSAPAVEVIRQDKQLDLELDDAAFIKASPFAKSFAKTKGFSLKDVHGTGPSGRVVKSDVLHFWKQQGESGKDIKATVRRKEITNTRQVIADRLVESKMTAPHFYLTSEFNVDNLLEVRSKIKDYGITINDLIIKAVALCLAEFPDVNVYWADDYIAMLDSVDVSVAISLEEGLVVPVIRKADTKSLSQISQEVKTLAEKSKRNRLSYHEYSGGSFTVSNLGMFSVDNFYAIINPPQSGIIAIGSVNKKPCVNVDGGLYVASMMNVSLSLDHRVVDGVIGAKFLHRFGFFMSNPFAMLI